MADEKTVPCLPCRSIDEIEEFYSALGFTRTHYQVRPNPYVALQREDLHLHFFGIPDFDPADSYGSCLVIVPDTGDLYRAFAAGMRAAYGKLLVSGIPRMTRPRKRKNADDLSGFTVVDPGGNWIRIFAAKPVPEGPAQGKLAVTLENAVVLGDSKGDPEQASKILDSALARDQHDTPPADLLEALVYRAELALRADDSARARTLLDQARAVPLNEAERRRLTETLTNIEDLAATLT